MLGFLIGGVCCVFGFAVGTGRLRSRQAGGSETPEWNDLLLGILLLVLGAMCIVLASFLGFDSGASAPPTNGGITASEARQ